MIPSSWRRSVAGMALVGLSAIAAWAFLILPASAQASDATLSALTVSPGTIAGFDKDTTEYAVGVANSVTTATVTPTASDSGATISIGGTGVTSGSGLEVTLMEGHNVVEIEVTAANGTTEKTYTVTIVRFVEYGHKLVDDIGIIPELMVGSRTLRGIASDGETMWVVSPGPTDYVYAFNMATGAPNTSGHVNVLALTQAGGGAPTNYAPQGIWVGDGLMLLSNGDTTIPTLFAYRFDPGSSSWRRAQGDDVTATKDARNTRPRGIWSDGHFIWVAHDGIAGSSEKKKKIFAYTLDNERVRSEDFNTLAAGNDEPVGIWSDGEIMWVADRDKTIYAYDMLTKDHLPAKDFRTLSAPVWGIWSDGETMWALGASGGEAEIRSYVMPRSSNADLRSLSLDGGENPDFDPQDTSPTLATDDLSAVVAVAAQTRHFRAQAAITPADANASMEGHQVDLESSTRVTVTVTAQDGMTTKTYVVEIGAAPAKPSVSLTANIGLIVVDWSAPSDTGSGDITSYDVQYRRAGTSGGWTLRENVRTVQSGGAFAYTIENLTGGQEYDVQVRARNRIGAGPWSANRKATPQSLTPQSAPRSVMVDAVDGEPSLNVTWSAPADAASYTISGYDVRYILTSADETADANWTLVDDASTSAGSRSYKIEDLQPGQSYDVQVRAANSAGDGPWSATETGTPNTPEVSISAGKTTITEGGGFSLTVRRSFSTDAALDVTVSVSESGDVIVDAGEREMTLTIAANSLVPTFATFVTTQGDSDWEEHSTVTHAIVADSAYTVSASAGSVAVVVEDDDFPAATAEISVEPATLAEGDSVTATVTVTTARLEEPHADGGDLLVTLGGTATSVSDYAAVTTADATLNFALADFAETDVNGTDLYRATKTVTTTTVDDVDQEDAETIVFTLGAVTSGTSPTAAAISLGTSSATATISASDQPAASTDATLSGLSLSAGALAPGFGSGIFVYTADVDYATHQITVTPMKNHGSATVEFFDGSDAAIDDANDDVEGQQVDLGVGPNVIKIKVTAEDMSTTLTYSVTVTRATPEVSITSAGDVSEGSRAVFIVSRNAAVPDKLRVRIFVSETGTMVSMDSGGTKYVTIQDGEASESLRVTTTTGNETWQAHSTVTATILPIISDYTIATSTAQLEVQDDDFPDATAALDLPPNPVGEGDPITATVTITTTRDEMPHRAGGQILVSTTNGTATAGADYTALTEATGTVEFDDSFSRVDTGAGVMRYQASRTVNITTLDDSIQEPAETIVVSIAAVDTGSSQTAPGITVPTGVKTATISASDQITASDDADLDGLTLSAGTLAPGFSSSVLIYTAQVDYETERITVTPVKSDGNARVSWPNTSDADAVATGHQVNLAEGSNEIQIKVTAEDGTATKTYSVTVTRAAASSDATLISLGLSVGTLDPAFSSSTMFYTAAVAYAVTRITVTPTTSDTDATVDYPSTTDADTNAAGHQVALDVGPNVIQIEVTAPDGSTRTYSVTVTRTKPVVSIGFGPAVSIGVRALEIFEGTQLVFTVHRNAAVDESLDVKVSISELGLIVPPHAEGRKTVTIDADKTSAGFDVPTADDRVWEAHSTVTATIVDAEDAYTINSAQGAASIEVLDNDFPSATAELTVSETNVDEGDVIVLTVTITTMRDEQPHADGGEIQISIRNIQTSDSDWDLNVPGGGNLNFGAGDFSLVDIGSGDMRYRAAKTATLLIVDDTEQEDRDELLFASIAPVPVGPGASPTANGITVIRTSKQITISANDQSNDATLASLSLSPGTLTPAFDSGTLVYSASVGYGTERITVRASENDSDASHEYLDSNDADLIDPSGGGGGHQVDLEVGENVFKIKVTAGDGDTTQTYTITVTRTKPEVSISVDAVTVTEGDRFDFTVTRNAAVAEALEVKINVTENGDMVEDGTYEDDRTVTISADQMSTTYPITTEDDSAWEAHSDVSATITSDDTYTIASGAARASKQVLDDEFPSATAALSVSPASVEEGGTVTATLTVTTAANQMPHRGGGDIQVNTADGTATAGSDYTSISQRVRVAAGEFTQDSVGGATRYRFEKEIPIQITDDSDSEGAETFSVSLARRPSGSHATVSAITVDTTASTVTINENDRSGVATLSGLTLSPGALSPGFGSNTFEYSASVSYGTNQVTVRPSKSDTTADLEYLDGDDNALDDADSSSGFQVDLAVGMTVFKIKLTAEDGSSTQTYTITVTRAQPEVSIEVAADEIKEWQPVVFTVSRDESAPEALDVIVVVSESGTMVSDADEGSKTVTIAADMTSQTLEAPTVKDSDWEEHSTVTAEITANVAYTIASGAATASKQVLDNDFPRATAWLRAEPDPVAEGGTLTATVTITTREDQRPHKDGGALVVSTTAGTASAADFTALTTAAGTLEFDAGDFVREANEGGEMRWVARQGATVAITDDIEEEGVESFTVLMTRPSEPLALESAITFAVNSDRVTVRISASDQPTASTDASLGGLTVSAGTLTPTFTSTTTSYSVSVPYPVSELTITAATSHAQANIAYLDSSDVELADAGVYQMGLDVGSNVVKIKVTAENGTTTSTYTLTITRTAASTDARLTTLTLSEVTLAPNFTAGTTTYTASVGYDVTRITVTPVKSDDQATLDYLDSSENVLADADNVTAGRQLDLAVGPNVVKIKVTAEDGSTSRTYTVTVTRAQPEVSVVFGTPDSSDPAVLTEGTGLFSGSSDLLFTISRSAAVDEQLDVQVTVAETGAMGVGIGPRTVSIGDGDASQTLALTTVDDSTWETHSTITVSIETHNAYTIATGERSASREIQDDDFPEATAVLSVSPSTVGEDDPLTATVTITTARAELPHTDGGEIQLSTANGSAMAGLDYTALTTDTGKLNFDASDFQQVGGGGSVYRARKSVQVAITDDDTTEPPETFTVRMASVASAPSPTNSAISFGTASATVTISASDQPVESSDATLSGLTLSAGTLSPTFPTLNTYSYTADVSYAFDQITVTPTKSDGNATLEYFDSSDRALADADTVASGHQVDLNVGSNNIFKIKVTAEDGTTTLTYTVTVTRAVPEVSITAAGDVTEGSPAEFSVSRNGAGSETLSVTVALSQSGSVLTSTGDRIIRIQSGQSSASLSVATAQDSAWEEHSAITATIQTNSAYTISSGAASATLDVRDDDFPEATAVLSVSPSTVGEGDNPLSATVTITTARAELPHTDGGAIMVVVTPGTATSADYTAPSTADATLEFDASDFQQVGGGVYRASKQATVAIVDDALREDEETFSVSMAPVSSGSSATNSEIFVSTASTTVRISASDQLTDSTDAALSELTLSAGTLNPEFDSSVETYTADVDYATDQITVTPTRNDGNATVEYPNSTGADTAAGHQVPLVEGPNRIEIKVTAQDGTTTRTYTVTVTRAAASSDATLSSLELNPGALIPQFSSGTHDYTAKVASAVTRVTVMATRSDQNAAVAFLRDDQKYEDADAHTQGHQIDIGNGTTEISVSVTAQDGVTEREYIVSVMRLSGDADLNELTVTSDAKIHSVKPDDVQDDYSVDVRFVENEVTIAAEPNNGKAEFKFIGVDGNDLLDADDSADGHQVALDEGENVIKIRVTAEDPAVKRIYTLTVTRHEMERVSRIAITGVANTEATAGITTINPLMEMQTVYLRYRRDGSTTDPWQPTQPLTEDTSTTNASTTLGGLTPGGQYELQASLDQDFHPVGLKSRIFSTLVDGEPGVSSVTLSDERGGSVSVMVDIANLDTEQEVTVHVRYRVAAAEGQASSQRSLRAVSPGTWQDYPSQTKTVSAGGTVTFELTDLEPGVEYDVQASLDGTFDGGVRSASFDTASQAQPRTSGGGGGGGGPPPVPIPSEVEFEWNVTRDIEALDGGNDLPTGLWSDGETLWVLENAASGPDRLFAYDLDSGERQSEREFELDRRNRFAHGIWSDGETVWIADSGQDQLFAYELASGERLEERDIELHEDNRDPRGIWSDGETLYVLDSVKDALFAYELESGELLAEYPLDQLNRSPRGLWSDGVTFWVSDDGAKRLFAYRIEDDLLIRHEQLEFTFRSLLKAGNGAARGIWSDADVIFVADEQDDRVYTYNMPDALDARLAALSLSGLSLAEFSPQRTEYRVTAAAALGRTTIELKPEQDQAQVEIEPDDIDADPQNGHQVDVRDGQQITVRVSSADASRSQLYRVRIQHCLTGLTAERLSTVRYAGGSVDELLACARSLGSDALYHQREGVWVAWFLDGPELINRYFRQRFNEGLPAGLQLVAKREPT